MGAGICMRWMFEGGCVPRGKFLVDAEALKKARAEVPRGEFHGVK